MGFGMDVIEILRCPRTGNRLRFDDEHSIVHVEGCDVRYPVVDGIVDFCGEAGDEAAAAYDRFAPRYDAYMTDSGLLMRAYGTIVWGIRDDREIIDTVFSYLPAGFDGVLVDVPVGTGVFTSSVYGGFPNATIIGIDSSMGMLQEAKERFEREGVDNVCLVRADANNLPLADGAADIVLWMNGLHVFADKQRAIGEMRRVVCNEGKLVACGYAKGARRLADWFVRLFAVPRGFFSPPFLAVDDIGSQLEGFAIRRQGNFKSFVYFEAVKTALTGT